MAIKTFESAGFSSVGRISANTFNFYLGIAKFVSVFSSTFWKRKFFIPPNVALVLFLYCFLIIKFMIFLWLQTIQVGHDYQATVPDGLCKYGDAPGNP